MSITPARQARIDRAAQEAARRRRAAVLGDDVAGDAVGGPEIDLRMDHVGHGVTLTWLHHIFKRDRITTKQLLIDCPVLRSTAGGGALYDVATAAQYLVKPKFDIKRLLGTMKEGDLPDDLKPKIWQARLSEQRFLKNARMLWFADDILATFGEVFKRMKETTQLWADDMAEDQSLTDDQRAYITKRVDELQADWHKTLLQLAKDRKTPSQAEKNAPDEQEDD